MLVTSRLNKAFIPNDLKNWPIWVSYSKTF